jgi:hypothetical protein
MKRNILIVFLLIQVFNGLSQSTIFYSDTINFEKPCDYLYIDSTSTNLWQIGIPNKTIFDSAYSKPFAIITDTINNYTLNNHSKFILKLEPESIEYDGKTIINFWHKFDTDSINDYGVVEVSYDEGNDWKVLYTDTTYNILYFRNGSGAENYLVTGQSNGWVNDFIEFNFYLTLTGVPEKIWLRFSFYSDSIQNEKEGWMIDNIQITGYRPWGIEENKIFNSSPYPNPCQEYLFIDVPKIENVNFTLIVYDLSGKMIESKKFINEQINIITKQLNNGIFFYRMINNINGSTSYGKFIVKK